ncbi:MAG TPA: PIN domain-containing protein [Chloroflexota bacterium]|nr:PIN domain-containing protein [Chloroflexota bacterium]
MLDSSVLVPVWSRLVLQRLAAPPRGRFAPVWSEWIIAETWRVLTRRWLAEHGPDADAALARAANRMLRRLLVVMRLASLHGVVGPAPWPGLGDEDDAPIWATAVVAGARYVVSHNTGDFPPLVQGRHAYAGVEYLTAVEFVEDVLGEDAAAVYGAPLPQGAPVRSGRRP